ncbi:MAG: DUF4142 domain-containing protein [Chthoniobacterales bacterium]
MTYTTGDIIPRVTTFSTESQRSTSRGDNHQKKETNMLKSIALVVAATTLAAFSTVHAQTSATAAAPNDPQIVLTADTVDVDYGKLAVKKTKNAEVKAFAETMIRDHTAVNDKAAALAKELSLTPEASDTSKSLAANGHKELATLKKMHGAEFDKAYVDNEVSYHEAVIGVLTSTLIPNAKNADLKALLESGKPIFESHLEHAKEIQKTLNK